MLKVVNGGAPKTRKLILGFDAGCGTCADLAAGVQEKVGDKLEVQNLNDPQLMAWREEALGKDAKWTPTLFEVEGEKVLKVWAGWRMGYALSRKLGPSSTWQVMQALGEVGGAPKVEESAVVEKLPEKAAAAVSGMSRGKFLKGVGGAALAMSILSSGVLASPAKASRRNKALDTMKSTQITGARRMQIAYRTARNRDARLVVGQRLSSAARVRATKPTVVRRQLRNGIVIFAVAYQMSSRQILTHYEFSRPIRRGHSTSLAKLWQASGTKNVLVKASEGGELWRKPQSSRRPQSGGIEPLQFCPVVDGGTAPGRPGFCGFRTDTVCVEWNRKACFKGVGTSGLACGACASTLYWAAPTLGQTLTQTGLACGGCSWAIGWTIDGCCAKYGKVTVAQKCPTPGGP